MTTKERDTLAKVQIIASIISAVAIPIVIAVVGWAVQAKIADKSAQKDYVSMAIGVLSDQKNDKNTELRQWAASLLNKTSPVPFPSGLQEKLASGEVVINKLWFPTPPPQLMEPPLPFKQLPSSGTVTNRDLLNNWIENRYRLQVNAATQKALQQWTQDTAGIVNRPAPAATTGDQVGNK